MLHLKIATLSPPYSVSYCDYEKVFYENFLLENFPITFEDFTYANNK